MENLSLRQFGMDGIEFLKVFSFSKKGKIKENQKLKAFNESKKDFCFKCRRIFNNLIHFDFDIFYGNLQIVVEIAQRNDQLKIIIFIDLKRSSNIYWRKEGVC